MRSDDYAQPQELILVVCERTGFSINFATLAGTGGEAFREECRASGKELFVWTVNARNEMIEATKVRASIALLDVSSRRRLPAQWGVKAILTDKTADYLELRASMKGASGFE